MKGLDKPVKIILTGDAKAEYRRISEDKNRAIILKSIYDKSCILKSSPNYGFYICKSRIPKNYAIKYDINNLWKVNLASAWRMIYSLYGTKNEIAVIILDIICHKAYEKKLGYNRNKKNKKFS